MLISLIFFLIPHFIFAQTAELINHFHSDITINQDTSITITETIDYFTDSEKHGIYRYIPVTYNRDNLRYTTSLSEITVTDDKHNPIPYRKSRDGANVVLKIGDPDATFSGSKTYVITYTITNALKRFDHYDELYWDIVGEGWQFPINLSTATIHSPHAVITDNLCFSGIVGSNDNLCTISSTDENTSTFSYNQPITYGNNITVAIKLDQTNTSISFPTKFQRILKTINDNIIYIFLLFPTVILFYLWNKYGRDNMFLSDNIYNLDPHQPQKTKPLFHRLRTPLHYEPFKNLTPGEIGAILDERVDNQDIIAEIIDLARKKNLKIEPAEETGFIFKKTDYVFTKLNKPTSDLPAHQKYLLDKLFSTGDTVKLSQLKGSFYQTMDQLKTKIFDSTVERKLFTRHPKKTQGFALFGSILLIGLAFVIGATSLETGSPLGILIPLLQIPLVPWFIKSIVQKSAIGTNYSLQAKGLQETISRGRWREQIKEKKLFIEEILPFAISLGVIKKLTADMEVLDLKPPQYLNSMAVHNISTAHFVNSFTSEASQQLSYNPSSSRMSGGSGFSSGSSGGGGGGGGGGSW